MSNEAPTPLIADDEEKGLMYNVFLSIKIYLDLLSMGRNFIGEFAGGLPGIDEATSFSQMIK